MKLNFVAEYGQRFVLGKTNYTYHHHEYYYLKMDTELLKTFMEVSRTRHFGRAAENLYLTQSAVSFRIRQLEGLLGVDLFVRQRNNIQLTAAGERLIPLAENSVLLEQRIRQEVASITGKQQQLLIGATPTLWEAWLQQYLGACIDAFPDVSLTALSHSSTNLVRQLIERTLDLAFVLDAPKVDELTTVEVKQLPLYLVGAEPYEDWQQVLEDNYVLIDWGTSFQIQHAQEIKTKILPALRTNTGRIALDYILKNGGAAYLPRSLVKEHLQAGRLFILPEAPILTRTLFASFHAASGREDIINTVIELIANQQQA